MVKLSRQLLLILIPGITVLAFSGYSGALCHEIKGCYASTITADDGGKEFFLFTKNNMVYFMPDSIYALPEQKRRIAYYGTKAKYKCAHDSIKFELDSLYIGKGTFKTVVFGGKKMKGETKYYDHNLVSSYSGIIKNDSLIFSVLSVYMKKDTTRTTRIYVRHRE